jgi:phosphatidylinositol dimannoside acyltransferase
VGTDGLRGTATYLAYRSLGAALGCVPEAMADASAAVVGAVMARLPGQDLAMRERHLRRVLGSVSPAVPPDPAVVRRWALRSYRSYARYWVEGARLPRADVDQVRRRMIVQRGYEHLEGALAAGRGAILALPHVGSWEWGGAFLASDGHRMTSVAERIEPARLFDWFVDQRRAMGIDIVPLGEESGRTVLRRLRTGGLVGLLCDRDIVGNGIEVELFGERTTLPAGPATLALRTGAALLVGVVYSGPGRFHTGVIDDPIDASRAGPLRADVTRLTEEIARRLEVMIRRAPEQWHLYQPNWPSDRAG